MTRTAYDNFVSSFVRLPKLPYLVLLCIVSESSRRVIKLLVIILKNRKSITVLFVKNIQSYSASIKMVLSTETFPALACLIRIIPRRSMDDRY